MRDCTLEERQRIIGNRTWYKGAKCVNDRSKVHLKGNWFYEQHELPFIAIVECDPSKRQCRSKDEIKQFVNSKPFYFIQ